MKVKTFQFSHPVEKPKIIDFDKKINAWMKNNLGIKIVSRQFSVHTVPGPKKPSVLYVHTLWYEEGDRTEKMLDCPIEDSELFSMRTLMILKEAKVFNLRQLCGMSLRDLRVRRGKSIGVKAAREIESILKPLGLSLQEYR